ncbi:oligosaccharide flippase family protein [Patescibacteria group bacterium]
MIGKNILIEIILTAIGALVTFFTVALSARLFGPEIIGNVAYVLGVTGLIFAFSDLGFSKAHVHFTAVDKKPKKTLGTFLGLKTILLLLTALIALIIGFIKQDQFKGIFALILAYELISRFANSILITFEGLQKSLPQNLTRLITKIIKLIAVILISYQLTNNLGFGLTYLVESLSLILISFYLIRRFLPLKYDRSLVKKYLKYSLPFFIIVPLGYLQTNFLTIILKKLHSATQLGYYQASASLTGFIKTFFGAAMIYFFPKISSLSAAKDSESIRHYADLAIKYLLIIFTPVFMFSFLVRKELIILILGNKFIPAIPVFSLLLLGTFILMIIAPYTQILFATKNHKPLIKADIASLFLSIGLAIWLVPSLGAKGIVIASIGAWSLNGFWHYYLIKKHLNIQILPKFFRFIVPALLILIFTSYLFDYFQVGIVLKLVLTVISISIYPLILFLLKLINRQDIKYLKAVIKPKS